MNENKKNKSKNKKKHAPVGKEVLFHIAYIYYMSIGS